MFCYLLLRCPRLAAPWGHAGLVLALWLLPIPAEVRADAPTERPDAAPAAATVVTAPAGTAEPGAASPADAAIASKEPPAGYTAAIDLGVQEFGLGNFEEARARFIEAHRIYPNARTLRALGMVAYELRHYVSSILYLEQALASGERPLTERLRQECERLLARAEGYVARYRVSLKPPEADIWVDGSQVELSADGTLVLPVGDHVIESRAPGHLPQRRRVRVLGGDREALELALTPTAGQPTPAGSERREARARRTWLWVSAAAVVAAGATAGLVLGLRDPGSRKPAGGTTGETIVPEGSAALRF